MEVMEALLGEAAVLPWVRFLYTVMGCRDRELGGLETGATGTLDLSSVSERKEQSKGEEACVTLFDFNVPEKVVGFQKLLLKIAFKKYK